MLTESSLTSIPSSAFKQNDPSTSSSSSSTLPSFLEAATGNDPTMRDFYLSSALLDISKRVLSDVIMVEDQVSVLDVWEREKSFSEELDLKAQR